MSLSPRLRTVSLIIILVFIWGSSWPIYKTAVAYTPPMLFAGLRALLGGLFLLVIALPRWRNILFRKHIGIYLYSTLFNVIIFLGVQTFGLTIMPGGLFSVIVFIQPVLVGILAWLWLKESMSFRKMVGLFLGFIGVAIVSFQSFGPEVSILGISLAVITAISWAFGAIFLKKEGGHADPLWLVTIQSLLGGLILTAIGSSLESWTDIVWNTPFITGLLFGMVLGIPTAWLVYYTLIRSGETSKVATFTFLVPVISVTGSTIFLDEPFHMSLLISLVLVASSIYLVNREPATKIRGIQIKHQESVR